MKQKHSVVTKSAFLPVRQKPLNAGMSISTFAIANTFWHSCSRHDSVLSPHSPLCQYRSHKLPSPGGGAPTEVTVSSVTNLAHLLKEKGRPEEGNK